jgi:hypothetical protein
MKTPKHLKNAHTSNSKIGMGDYYGTAIKQKIGKNRSSLLGNPVTPKKLKTPPKGLA